MFDRFSAALRILIDRPFFPSDIRLSFMYIPSPLPRPPTLILLPSSSCFHLFISLLPPLLPSAPPPTFIPLPLPSPLVLALLSVPVVSFHLSLALARLLMSLSSHLINIAVIRDICRCIGNANRRNFSESQPRIYNRRKTELRPDRC